MKILVIKHGALGDVLRHSFFFKPLKTKRIDNRLFLWTSMGSLELVKGNPYLDGVFTDSPNQDFDLIYSLEEDHLAIRFATEQSDRGAEIIGLYYDNDQVKYTNNTEKWFDMSLVSEFGLSIANDLKASNRQSHLSIFSSIYDVNSKAFDISYYRDKQKFIKPKKSKEKKLGLNLYAGNRWPSKSLSRQHIEILVDRLIQREFNLKLFLGPDQMGLEAPAGRYRDCIETVYPKSIDDFVDELGSLDWLITADSLALHLAESIGLPMISFFTVTSPFETNTGDLVSQVYDVNSDYFCSYKSKIILDWDISSRLFEAVIQYCE